LSHFYAAVKHPDVCGYYKTYRVLQMNIYGVSNFGQDFSNYYQPKVI
jgi:hypothetical protein